MCRFAPDKAGAGASNARVLKMSLGDSLELRNINLDREVQLLFSQFFNQVTQNKTKTPDSSKVYFVI